MGRERNLRSERGQTMVEFALVLPIVVLLLFAVVEMGIVFNHYVTLTDAARAGARKAIVVRLGGATQADARQAALDAASGLDPLKLGLTILAPSWTTPGSEVTVTATYPCQVDLLIFPVKCGTLTSVMKERLE